MVKSQSSTVLIVLVGDKDSENVVSFVASQRRLTTFWRQTSKSQETLLDALPIWQLQLHTFSIALMFPANNNYSFCTTIEQILI